MLVFAGRTESEPQPARGSKNSLIREEQTVMVDGVSETWRLEWRKAPHPVCDAADDMWFTCPCEGFAFGEGGIVDLVRLRNGAEVDRLALAPLFTGDFSWEPGEAVFELCA